ncbi:kinase-like protein [Cenococcum geophilum]
MVKIPNPTLLSLKNAIGYLVYYLKFLTGFNITNYLSSGLTSIVYLDSSFNTPTIKVKRRIYKRFYALAFIYLINVIYIDLTYGNISLDDSLYAKLLNFSSSLLDSSKPFIILGLKEIEITNLFKQSKFPKIKSRFISADNIFKAINFYNRTYPFAPPLLKTTIAVLVLSLLIFLTYRLVRR